MVELGGNLNIENVYSKSSKQVLTKFQKSLLENEKSFQNMDQSDVKELKLSTTLSTLKRVTNVLDKTENLNEKYPLPIFTPKVWKVQPMFKALNEDGFGLLCFYNLIGGQWGTSMNNALFNLGKKYTFFLFRKHLYLPSSLEQKYHYCKCIFWDSFFLYL